jgi:hypothetical protein
MALYHKDVHWKVDYDEQVDNILRESKYIILTKHLKDFLEYNCS